MRRPKALLPWYHQLLFEHLFRQLQPLCASVFLVGRPRLEFQAYPLLEDALTGCGPLGGIAAALQFKPGPHDADICADLDPWRLVLSVDCPFVSVHTLRRLLAAADAPGEADVIVPETEGGVFHPLCSVWHSRLRGPVLDVLEAFARDPGQSRSSLGVQRFLRRQKIRSIPVENQAEFQNLNTMQQYLAALGGHPPG